MAIDIGPGAVDRVAARPAGYTFIDLANSSNGTGIINSVELYFDGTQADVTGVKVGIFYGSALSYTCRSSASIGTVTKGSKQTFSLLNLSVQTGDFLGVYATAGSIECATTGGSGIVYKLGDHLSDGAQTYELFADNVISIYGTGVTLVGPKIIYFI